TPEPAFTGTMADDRFREAYLAVFDLDGGVKDVGRKECRRLIREAERVSGEEDIFGSLISGMMNIVKIKKLAGFMA
ncbi:MAG: hypothetical protein LUI02_06285, partial [Clostridiales bacterium]|nr:hypothetical protein [Clostridiales bacterium]